MFILLADDKTRNILKKDAKTMKLEWDGQEYTYRQLVRHIGKKNLFPEVKKRAEEKANDIEDKENLKNS